MFPQPVGKITGIAGILEMKTGARCIWSAVTVQRTPPAMVSAFMPRL
jgi:hypothetical protein